MICLNTTAAIILSALAIWIVFWLISYRLIGGGPFEFDFNNRGSFLKLMKPYSNFFGNLVLVSSATIAFLGQAVIGPASGAFGIGISVVFIDLAFSVVASLAFIGLTAYFYEGYLHDTTSLSGGYAMDWNSYTQSVYESIPVLDPVTANPANGAVNLGSGLTYNPCMEDLNCQ